MEGLKIVTQGLLTATAYCLAFQLSWHCSLDQWYLPAGLRIAALLLAPSRLLPWILMGDVAALLMIRVPAISSVGVNPTWAYASPWILVPAIALVPIAIRARYGAVHRAGASLIPMLLVTAVWGALCTLGTNIMLDGPSSAISGVKFARFAVGDYLGMLMVVLPVLLWTRRHDEETPSRLTPHCALAVLATALIFALATLPQSNVARLGLMSLLIVPAVLLTWLHGWRGAAIGVVLANTALAFSLRNTGVLGAYDSIGFVVQVMLATTATGLFVLGARISSTLAEVRLRLLGEQQALDTAKLSYLWAERELREHVIEYVDIEVQMNRLRRDIESHLKSRGQHEAAMRMIRTGSIQSKMLHEYINALYPLEIETHGLYHVFRSPGFASSSHTEIHPVMLRGNPMQLSVGLQLAVYRCTQQAIACLPPARRHTIKARVGKLRGLQGIAVSIYGDKPQIKPASRAALENTAELSSRVRSYGGTCRRHHTSKISFFVSEPTGTRSIFRYDEPAVTTRECL
ncbi:histidine kinase [Xanthomonas arboricola]|uniref:Histidine kinase n=1 Tax=Xanthomonas campestris pv. juglandis TaxID=195709 RepID=A0A8E4EQP8_XANCJ|nr:MASE1 domain-containing protein [Xanthomonas arboricola]KOA98505.1 histidine kinase [Xanthomonas arboricola]KOB16755.1 histidine kinase [Xanthomonas arboricola]KOB35836.1 histidine kinase [Xanthomonas arboricola]OAH87599.1 histidine kinase [Xanthomonas arboricola pv. juglandis]CAD1792359.1 MASE1 domain-containing protein [Xanthomonas arboricola pv. juglandis]